MAHSYLVLGQRASGLVSLVGSVAPHLLGVLPACASAGAPPARRQDLPGDYSAGNPQGSHPFPAASQCLHTEGVNTACVLLPCCTSTKEPYFCLPLSFVLVVVGTGGQELWINEFQHQKGWSGIKCFTEWSLRKMGLGVVSACR